MTEPPDQPAVQTSRTGDQNQATPFEIENLVPPEWVAERKGKGAVIMGYEVQGLPPSLYDAPIAADLKGVRVFFGRGEVGYREDVRVTRFWVDEQGRFNVADPEPTKIVKAPQGIYALFISPFTETPGTNAGELAAEERIDVATGLLGSFQGRNIVYRKAFTNILRYVEYLYHDVLRHLLKLPAERRLENVMRASAFDYSAELRSLTKD